MAILDPSLRLSQTIIEFRCGYLTGQVRKREIDLTEFKDANYQKIYDYFGDDSIILIFWVNQKFLIAKN